MISRVRIIRWAILLLLTLGLAIAIGHPSYAQLGLPDGFGTKSRLTPPTGVSRYGSIEVATVRSPIDGRDLFSIASPTVYDRNTQESQTLNLAVETRAKEVEARLLRAITRPMDLKTLEVQVSRLNNVTIIDAQDRQFTRPLVLVSVTKEDADYHGQPIDELAREWQTILDRELKRGLQRFSVGEFSHSFEQVSQILFGLVIFTVVLTIVRYGVALFQKRLRRRKQEIAEAQTLDRSVTLEQSPPPTTEPNSAITEVKNLTRTWSRVNFTIDVAYQTNPEKALDVLREVCQNFYEDPHWHDKMIASPDVLGIDSISHSGMTIAIWIQTLPAQQWAVGREFRLRVRKALEANGIAIGVPRLDNSFTLS